MMDCEDCRNILLDSLATEDHGSPASEAAGHLEACPDCRDWWVEVAGASRCLERTQPPLMEAPPVSSVWSRIRESGGKAGARTTTLVETLTGWLVDVFGVLGAAAVIAVAGLGIRTLLLGSDVFVPILSIPLGSLVSEAWVAVALVVLFGTFAGACSAPLLLRGCDHGSRRHA